MATATRTVRAPRGPLPTGKSWPQEAALRMPKNHLAPDVAERPEDLLVAAGLGGMGGAQPLAAAMNDAAALGIEPNPATGRSTVVTSPAGYPEAPATAGREGVRLPMREGRAC